MLEVKLNKEMLQQLIDLISKVKPDSELYAVEYTRQIKFITETLGLNDKSQAEIDIIKKKLENLNTSDKLGSRLINKLMRASRPLKLQKNEKQLIAKALRDVKIDYSMLCKYSSITNANAPNKFFGYPKLKAAIDTKISAIKQTFDALTRADIDTIIT